MTRQIMLNLAMPVIARLQASACGPRASRLASVLLACLLLAVGCANTSVNNPYPTGDSSLAGRIKECRTGDTRVGSSDGCLQDDAACYQLADGDWCTGPRGTSCPAGSTELPAGSPCPTGTRCFQISESKNCAISFQ